MKKVVKRVATALHIAVSLVFVVCYTIMMMAAIVIRIILSICIKIIDKLGKHIHPCIVDIVNEL